MRRINAFAIILLLSISSSSVLAESEQRISIDLARGMISTAPITNGEIVIIKSIGNITALDIEDGKEKWVVEHTTPHLFEISPPLFHSVSGKEMLLVGWTDGMVCAYDVNTGVELWNYSTEMKGYGITGALLIDENAVIVPYDHGLMALDTASGLQLWDVAFEEELFYRSSPVTFDDSYLMGSESGILWKISPNSAPTKLYSPVAEIESAKIRGPVLTLDERVLIPVQGSNNGSLIETDFSSTVVHSALGTIAMLAEYENWVVAATSQNTTIYDCSTWCTSTQILTDEPVTGEVDFNAGIITLPVNDGSGKWLRFGQDCTLGNCTWVEIAPLIHSRPQYLTAGVGNFVNAVFMVNDAGWVDIIKNDVLKEETSNPKSQNSSDNEDIFALIFIIPGVIMIVVGMRKEGWENYLPALGASIILLGAGYYLQAISDLTSDTSESVEDPLRKSIPELWNGTQVVVFDFGNDFPSRFLGNETFIASTGEVIETRQFPDGGRVYVGGFEGYGDVRSLTIAATEIASVEYVEHHEGMGYRVDRIGTVLDGEFGLWLQYYEDGKVGLLAIDANSIDDDAVIIWKLI